MLKAARFGRFGGPEVRVGEGGHVRGKLVLVVGSPPRGSR